MNMISRRVFVVDDDSSFLGGLMRLLRASGYVTEGFSSAKEALRKIPPDVEGCILVDLQMPEMDGMELQAALARSGSPLTVVFLTAAGDIPVSVRAIKSGADDFLMKTAPKEDIFAAIDRALARSKRECVQMKRRHELLKKFSRITPREKEVLGKVLKGQINKQIAWDLGIDERSVKRHRTNFMRKLDVRSVAELVHLAIEAGFITENGLISTE